MSYDNRFILFRLPLQLKSNQDSNNEMINLLFASAGFGIFLIGF